MPPQQSSYSRKEHKQTYDQQRCTDNRDLPCRVLDLDGFPSEQVPQAKHTLFSSHGIFHSFYLSDKAVFLHYPPFCPSAHMQSIFPTDRSPKSHPRTIPIYSASRSPAPLSHSSEKEEKFSRSATDFVSAWQPLSARPFPLS